MFGFGLFCFALFFGLSNGMSLVDDIFIKNIYMVENYDSWIYKCEISGINIDFELAEVYVSSDSNPTWNQGYQMHYSGSYYYFNLNSNDDIPLHLMLVSSNGQTLIRNNVITSFEVDELFSCSNFWSNADSLSSSLYDEFSITSGREITDTCYKFKVNLDETTETISNVYLSDSDNNWIEAEEPQTSALTWWSVLFSTQTSAPLSVKMETNNGLVLIKNDAITNLNSDCTFKIGIILREPTIIDNEHDWCQGFGDLCPNVCDSYPCDCDSGEVGYCKLDTCHSNGCDECMSGAFKMDYDYPCKYCNDVAGSHCKFCTDFTGCQQCDDGYTLTDDWDCKSPRQNPMKYCRPNYCSSRKLNGIYENEQLMNRMMNLEKQ